MNKAQELQNLLEQSPKFRLTDKVKIRGKEYANTDNAVIIKANPEKDMYRVSYINAKGKTTSNWFKGSDLINE